ncbi:MAG: hypothetical protein JWM35_767 [Verrucomicrobia bacterium]|nr:hypothetical protein [Verrucomicrobiota bacterium]
MKPTSLNTIFCKRLLVALLPLAWTASAFAYTYAGSTSVWQPGSITMHIKLGTTPTLSDGSNYSTCAQNAMGIWNSSLGNVQFASTIDAVSGTDSTNLVNELAFSATVEGTAWGSGVLAVTLSSSFPSVHERVSSDILFNTAYTWDSYRGNLQSSTKDLRRVALHELGHVLGLDHPDQAGQTVTAIMNSTISNLDTLAADDISGVQSLYGLPGVTTPPANDAFTNATAITLSSNAAVVIGTTVYATKETGEPNHAGHPGGKSSWWKWVATSGGTMTIDTNGSRFDTMIAVYTGSSVSALTSVASNDDAGTNLSYSMVTFPVVNGTTYWIAVDGFINASVAENGYVTLNLTLSPTATLVAPSFATQPASVTLTPGGTAQFTVVANGNLAPTLQWQRLPAGTGTWVTLSNSGSYTGVTTATLTVSSAALAMTTDRFRCVATNATGTATSTSAILTVNSTVDPGRLINLSVRSFAGTGAQTLIVGIVIGGAGTSASKPVLIRGVGPTLTTYGVPGALVDPQLELYVQGAATPFVTNDDWAGNSQITFVVNAVGAFAFSSSASKDAALYTSPAGGVYSVKVLGAAGTTGIALAEIYDATPAGTFAATTPRLVNVSARTQVGTDASALIAGFVIGGTTPCKVMIRGIGPTLTGYGVPGALADPYLELFLQGSTTPLNTNDDWSTASNAAAVQAAATQVGAFSLASGSKDAVLYVTLQPGIYSAKVSGVNNTTGVGLVEIYEVP